MRSTHRKVLRWLALGLSLGAAGVLGAIWLYQALGKTPGELLDHAEHRLIGHPSLQSIALPIIGEVREVLDAPNLAQRQRVRFLVPSPPQLLLQPEEATAGVMDSPREGIIRVGAKRKIASIGMAAKLAKDGDVVEIDAGEYFGDVAVWNQRRLTIRGAGGRVRLHAAGQSAEEKAIWVIRDGNFDISNIEFVGAKVADHNGAGIRFENGHLRIRECLFWANENGILTGAGSATNKSIIEVDNCEFGYNGHGDGLSHSVYIGGIDRLRISGSYFHHGNVGHFVKSRARTTELYYNRISDEAGGRSSYEVDIPNGGMAVLVGNIIQQTRETENSTMIAYAREGYRWPDNRLYLANNTLVNDHPYGGAFVWAEGGDIFIVSANNLLSGPGKYHTTSKVSRWNDIEVSWEQFVRPNRYDYRLNAAGRKLRFKPLPPELGSRELVPTHQFDMAKGIGTIPLSAVVHPGALQ